MGYIVAADTGGTFTDLVAYDPESGRLIYTKSLTTYGDLVEGVMDTVRKADLDLSRADIVKFGTTLVINTFVQRNGARIALVTTEGFRDVLEIRRGNRSNPFDLRYRRNPALVDRDHRFEVPERMGADGAAVVPLDTSALTSLAEHLRRLEIEAVAISFINSYVNSAHEEEAASLLRRLLPGVYVTAGTELTREWYEYERTATAAANGYVGPRLQQYVAQLDGRLRSEGFSKSFFMMASNGGVFSVDRSMEQPVMLVESGPVGGCIGATVYARELDIPKLIAFDMGGTTAKCAVVENGAFEIKSPYYVGGDEYGFPVRGAVVDIVEVGAGGGSIAWIDGQGRLRVGPRSAGSDPGPVAYGRGGTEPTITDANLCLGRIDAASFLGGEMSLDRSGAIDAIRDTIATPLGFHGQEGLDEVADGILTLGIVTMAGAIRQVTIERGMDPRDFKLFAFGGGGPLHAATLARELNIPEVVIPPEPGNFSAVGMLMADARVDETHTFLRPLNADIVDEMGTAFDALEARMRDSLARDVGSSDITFQRAAEMRYRGQKQAIRADIGNTSDLGELRGIFNETYQRRYGHMDPAAPVEFVSLILIGSARLMRPKAHELCTFALADDPVEPRTRLVYFAGRGRVETPVYSRNKLARGFAGHGPAVIEEYGSTTIVGPDDLFSIGNLGEIVISLKLAEKTI